MTLDAATWSQVAELFDALADLPAVERERILAETDPPPEVVTHLQRLLAAHDTPESILLDQSLDEVVVDLFGDRAGQEEGIPGDLAGRRFGNWTAREELGRGGMCVVLSGARADGQFEKKVAIKVLAPGPTSPARQERLRAEIRLLARLEHGGVARLLDGGISEDGLPYLVLEYVDGLPITVWCERHSLGVEERVALFLKAAEAVAYSHRRLVVHCDIKPANVLVDPQGQVKLVDFGIASLLSDPDEALHGGPGVRCSPAYAAPEQLRGEPPSVAQDVFGLGTLLYELLCGRRIRDLRTVTSVLVGRPLPGTITPPSEQVVSSARAATLRGDLDRICARALASAPEDRYPSVEALVSDLHCWQKHLPVEARAGGPLYYAGKWLRRNRWVAAAAGVATLSLLGGTGAALWQAQEAARSAATAETALEETEEALQRSEALRDFLISLFEAAEPDRPEEDMPTTRALLETGANQAMDAETTPAGERLGMLLTMGRVYASLNEYEKADPLILEAVELARERADDRPEELSRALRLKASVMREAGNVDEMAELAREAEELVAGDDAHWNLYARARIERAWLERNRRDYRAAVELLEPLYQEMGERDDVRPRVRALLLSLLGGAHSSVGELEEAAHYREQGIQAFRELYGPESRQYAVELANSAGTERELANFEAAESRLNEALELYDRIFEDPQALRAAARRSLARTLMAQGEHGAALEAVDESGQEWAKFVGREPERWEYYHLHRGSMLARMGRLEVARENLQHAERLIQEHDEDPVAFSIVTMLLAWVECRRGLVDRGELRLVTLDAVFAETLEGDPQRAAQLQEAHAACALQRERPEQALEAVESALEIQSLPGDIHVNVDRQLLRARILRELDRPEEAASAVERAREVLAEAVDDSHPLYEVIHSTARHLAL